MIIDAHTHVWLHDDEKKWDIFIDECRKNEVALAIVSCLDGGEPYPRPETVRAANATAMRFDNYTQGLTRWLAYINPQNTNWREEIDHCLTDGAIGIKLWISLKDAAGRLEQTDAVVEYASEKNLPILIHTFNRTDSNLSGEFDIVEFAALAERFPNASLIAAHAGGNWRHTLGVLRNRAPNAFVDVCGSYPQLEMVQKLVADIGAERIIFGSDMFGRSLASQLAKVTFAGISREEETQILWKNAVRAYRLEAVPNFTAASPAPRPLAELLDPNVDHFCFCGRWPFFETRCQAPAELDSLLAENQIRTAFTADLGSIYRFDIGSANNAFLSACSNCSRIAPLALVNPLAHNWQQIVENLDTGFAGVIVYPYLHAWPLDNPEPTAMFQKFAALKIPVWINIALDDYRFRHPGQHCRNVPDAELIAFCKSAPKNTYVFQGLEPAQIELLNAQKHRTLFKFEISRLTDRTEALANALKSGAYSNFVLGSEFPFRDIREVRWAAQRQL